MSAPNRTDHLEAELVASAVELHRLDPLRCKKALARLLAATASKKEGTT